MVQSQHSSGLPPSITISSRDLARLEAMLESPALSRHPAAIALSEELGRARIVAPEQMPADVVTMHSRLECQDELQGDTHTLTLVYPNEADVERHRVSVLAPVGSALLGLSLGQCIDWETPQGRKLRLRVTAIHYQPEAAGDFHR
ncbi:MAG: nucleoside diphosphate kinase regulator [Gammaproteobacteria bacterium]